MRFNKRDIKLFVLSGKAGSGKNTIAELIKKHYKNYKTISISFGHYIKDYAMRVSNWDGSEETKPRELLQNLGIELIRNKISKDLFIKRIFEDIEVFSYFYDVIIVTDARLLDEVVSLKSKYKDCICIRVIREDYDNNLTDEQKKHLTETDLDNYHDFDYEIINSDSVGLESQVIDILKEVE